MAETPRISIIMPAYNMQASLRAAIESAQAQEDVELEILVVDDGSTDDTPAILADLQAQDARMRVITTANHGQGHARNIALEQARGDYLMFLDADDFIEPDTASRLVEALEAGKCDFVVFPYRYFEHSPLEESQPVWDFFPEEGLYEGERLALLLEDNAYFAWNRFYAGSFLRRHRMAFSDGHIYEDVPFFVAADLEAQRARVVLEPVYCARSNPGSTTRSGFESDKHVHGFLAAVQECIALLDAHSGKPGIESFRYYFARYATRKFRRFYYERIPKGKRREFAKSFLGSMRNLGAFPVLKGNDRYLRFCMKHEVFSKERVLLFRALNFVLRKKRDLKGS